jgi:hypothetical protein
MEVSNAHRFARLFLETEQNEEGIKRYRSDRFG